MNISARCGLSLSRLSGSPTYLRSVERRKLGLRLTSARRQNQSQLVSASSDRSCVASKLLRYRWRTCLQLREFDQELDLIFGPNTRFCGLHCHRSLRRMNLNELQGRFGRYEGGCCLIPLARASRYPLTGSDPSDPGSDQTIECIVVGAYDIRAPRDLVGKLSISSGWWLPKSTGSHGCGQASHHRKRDTAQGSPSAVAANYTASGTTRT